jgi:3',5'-nucleoside bisphosphate phosphatase
MSAAATASPAVDLHLHSTASDGRLDPAALVRHAAACGVRHLALTDHDTMAGVAAAGDAARECGLGFVPGVELSAAWRGRAIHILGLAVDPQDPALMAALERTASLREERADRIADQLDVAGAPGQEARRAITAAGALPTRTHFARALVELGAARDLAEAFDRFLRQGRPGYVPTAWPEAEEVTGWIVAAGGVAVIAHPLRYTLSAGARRELGHAFRAAGGTAIEVATGGASAAQVAEATSLAVRTGLDGSVGSDFHDPAFAWNQPGRLAKLPASIRPVWSHPAFPRDFGATA